MNNFSSIPQALEDIKNGRMLILFDNRREKEAAEIEDFLVSFFETKKRGERVVIWYFFNLFFI